MSARLIIEINDAGALTINGPIHDKIFCYGLLEAAKDAVRENIDKAAKNRVVLAQPHPLVDYKGGNGQH